MTRTAPKITTAHALRMKFLGPTDTLPARWSVRWVGWPSDGGQHVQRATPSTGNRDNDVLRAADLFIRWLNGGQAGPLHVATIQYGEVAADELAVTITSRDERDT